MVAASGVSLPWWPAAPVASIAPQPVPGARPGGPPARSRPQPSLSWPRRPPSSSRSSRPCPRTCRRRRRRRPLACPCSISAPGPSLRGWSRAPPAAAGLAGCLPRPLGGWRLLQVRVRMVERSRVNIISIPIVLEARCSSTTTGACARPHDKPPDTPRDQGHQTHPSLTARRRPTLEAWGRLEGTYTM